MLIIGSKAFKKIFPLSNRVAKDMDVIVTKTEAECLIEILKPRDLKYNHNCISLIQIEKQDIFDTDNVELFICDNSPALTEYMKYEDAYNTVVWAKGSTLFSIKKSHIHFPIKFKKHIEDYCALYDHMSGVDQLTNITKLNFKETEDRLGKLKTPSLKKSVKSFFEQSEGYVKSFFIHDDIHIVMSHYDRPLYERMQPDKEMASCSKEMWENFTFEDKCKCVLEEAYVIALERKIIPMLFDRGSLLTSKEALDWSMMRVCTTLCSGFFREFATNNYLKIREYINPNYVEKFLESYRDEKIRMINHQSSSSSLSQPQLGEDLSSLVIKVI